MLNDNIKKFQIAIGGINLSLLPVAWILLKIYPIPEIVFGLHILINIIAQIARLIIVKPLISLSLKEYFAKVVIPCGVTTLVAMPIPFIMKIILPTGLIYSGIIIVTSIVCTTICVYYIGMTSGERSAISQKIAPIIKKIIGKYSD